MMWLGDFNAGDTVRFMWNTNDSNGASITRSTNGTISVYQNGNITQTTTGVTDTEDFDGLTGVHYCAVDTSQDGTFYAAGRDFAVVLSAATIDTRTVNAVLAHFSIRNRSALVPTTAGRTLDVTATGAAGIDWGNVENSTTAVNLGLSALTISGALTVSGGTTLTNSSGNGLVCSSSGGNGNGLALSGNGSGSGLNAFGGATGHGAFLIGGLTSGDGLHCHATNAGDGIHAESHGTNQHGLHATGIGTGSGIHAIGGATGNGMSLVGGSASGNGLNASVTSGNEIDANITGNITGNLSGSVGSLTTNNDKTGYTLSNTGIDNMLDRTDGVETGYTLRQTLRIMAAALAGKLSGAATATVTIRNITDSKARVTATVDADGNRSAVTLDGT